MICPACQQSSYRPLMEVGDHFLTKESFRLLQCNHCALLRTDPMPSKAEIGRYYKSEEYLSHGDQKKGLFASLYRQVKGYNLGLKSRLLNRLHPHASFLDYGCGTADLMAHCEALGMNVRGAEPSEDAIQHAVKSVADRIVGPEDELNSDRKYDIISMWHVLEHIHEPRAILERIKLKMNHRGHLVIALPNHDSLDARHYGSMWAAWDIPRHLWHYTPDQIILMCESLGFEHKSSHPMWFDAFYVSLLSERYKGGSPLAGLFWAALSNFNAIFAKKRKCSSQVYVFRLK